MANNFMNFLLSFPHFLPHYFGFGRLNAVLREKIFVKGSYNDSLEIPKGSEILTINNAPMRKLIQRLISLTSSDGFNPSYRQTKVAENFSVKYAITFGFPHPGVVDPQEIAVHPEIGQVGAVACLGLSDFVGMMNRNVIFSPAMDIKKRSQIF